MTLIKSLIFSKKEIEMSPARRKKKDVRVMLERLEPGPAGSNSSSVSAPKCLLTQCRSSGTWLWPHRGRMERGWEGEVKEGIWLRTDLFEGDSHRDLDKNVLTRERNPRWSQTGRRRDPGSALAACWEPAPTPPAPPELQQPQQQQLLLQPRLWETRSRCFPNRPLFLIPQEEVLGPQALDPLYLSERTPSHLPWGPRITATHPGSSLS